MLIDPVYLLPVFAIGFCIVFPVVDTDQRYTKSVGYRRYKNFRYKKKIFLRMVFVTIIVLSTILAVLGPEDSISNLTQALITTAVALSVIFIGYLIFELISWIMRRNSVAVVDADLQQPQNPGVADVQYLRKDVVEREEYYSPPSKLESLEQEAGSSDYTESVDLIERTYFATDQEEMEIQGETNFQPTAVKATGLLESDSGNLEDDAEAMERVDAELQAQLRRASELIDFHSLDDDDSLHGNRENGYERLYPSPGIDTPEARGEAIDGQRKSKIATTAGHHNASEGKEILAVNTKLENLIIAQQAAYEAERQAHDQTKTLASNAMTIMKIARRSQESAEKALRREQQERRHLQELNEELSQQLIRRIPDGKVEQDS